MLLLSDKPRATLLCSLFLLELWECPHSWRGVRWVQMGGDRDMGGLRAFPRYCLVLTPPSQPLHTQSERSSQQGADNSLLLCRAEGPVPIPGAVLELRGHRGGWDTQTPGGSWSATDPKALQPLLFNVANFVKWPGHHLGRAQPVTGTRAPLSLYTPKGTPPPSAKPP